VLVSPVFGKFEVSSPSFSVSLFSLSGTFSLIPSESFGGFESSESFSSSGLGVAGFSSLINLK
jgi:hypothetical protein